ncbi:Fumble domain-containing protein [Calidithermus roseus]|uniref:Type II pantothenate kinase n=1 Tax=Calidithermus roseus TaxID=1644118 RepID=A0A399F0U8_9DEIN|nr:Fumble domain-containing protein [Calidithermus roseus]RIH89600.1 Type II pantothenate kinase [Calidithermus roseus]
MKLGIDFGLTNTDAVLVEGERMVRRWTLRHTGPARLEVLQQVLAAQNLEPSRLSAIATTGGLHRNLPDYVEGVRVHKVGEAEAIGRGGLALAQLGQALVVSAGTGTAMIAARDGKFEHVTGSAVGGGTLLGLSRLLIGTADPLEVARLAGAGDSGGVDSTLADAIGGGIGHLPASATAVNFGRVAELEHPPSREDIAAGLFTIVGQVIGVIALNAARATGLEHIVIVGHLPDLEPLRQALERVWQFYLVEPRPLIPPHGGWATALGAALSAGETRG